MDVTLSIIAGLGLRIFLLNTVARTSGTLSTAALGIWEGAVLHQVSGRSSSPNFDHLLAYGLRLTVDLLISKDVQRLFLIVLWSTLGTVTSEAIIPYASLRSALKKRDRELRDRRNRYPRSISATAPTPSTSFPPRLRAYKPPETQSTSMLPENPPLNTSTPIFLSDRPPTPPSFFLEETFISPSPKPIILQTPQSFDTISPPPEDALPVRPRSGVASTFNHSSDTDSPLPVPIHLPTPPDSAQSANPPDALNDSQNNEIHDNQILGFAPDLAPIPEISSPEGNSTPIHDIESDPNHGNLNTGLQRISRWLESQPADLEPFFSKPFSPTTSPDRPVPVPVPARAQHQGMLWQTYLLPEEQQQTNTHEEIKLQANDISKESIIDTDSDELRTPGPRDELNAATDNENDDDPLQTPRQLLQTEGQLTPPHSIENEGEVEELSPLGINVRSALPDSAVAYEMLNHFQPPSSDSEQNAQEAPLHVMEENEILQIPGSLSQNLLLQPPLPASSPLFRPSLLARESSPPPSPSTILSDPSDASVLSTRVPGRLYSRADELRQQAREEEKLRAQLEDKRKLAERQGRTMDALNLKIKVRDMDLAAYRLHEKAARRYYTALNPLGQSHKIDVHGLRPREAFDRIERAIVRANEEKRTTVVVIVGKGLHSVNQQPTLKPVVMREMQRLKIKCEINPRNAGQLIITLPKHENSSS
ncbi:hypothetical protein BDN70DRAFT_872412 [Pholiota conissans]|uniref:Smr domain-containing protein n=1 Tax=Pholiota conissans TaxID=109636 RepID=A0A9P5ZCJ5_9AGAR|nr:hypothetical protein BDN70DRAFT_872412 [Pholiota conissans]